MMKAAVRDEPRGNSDLPESRRPAGKGSLPARFCKHNRGSVAIEFVMIALPFFLLIFAVVEVTLSFTAEQVMSNAVDDISRQLRTGQLKTTDVSDATKLKARICPQLFMAATPCPDLEVDLQTYATFKTVPTTIPLKSDNDVDVSALKVNPGGAGTINQLRIFYRWPILTDLMKTRIASIQSQGKTLLFSTVTWQNEPYL